MAIFVSEDVHIESPKTLSSSPVPDIPAGVAGATGTPRRDVGTATG